MSVVCRELFVVHRTPQGDAAALQGLSLEARRGELLAVLGPSGSGKSTLLRVISGRLRPSAGTVLLEGEELTRLPARRVEAVRRARIGLVGQHAGDALSPALSIGDAVALPLTLRGVPRREAGRRASELLDRVGLGAAAAARPRELSGGECQRAAVCVAIAHCPSVVLADEPTGELDAAGARQVLALLLELAEADGAAVLLVTHDPAGAAAAHRVVQIRDGRVSQEGEGGQRTAVVGRGGWLHVPEELLAQAGIGARARIRTADGAVVLEPAGEAPAPAAAPVPQAGPVTPAPITPVPVEVRALSRRFGSRVVLDGLDATFAPGTLTAVTGRSGSGKSTLLALLAGLQRADGGSVVVAGRPLEALDAQALAALRREHVGVVAQDPRLAPFLAAAEQVALGPLLAGASPSPAAAAARRWLAALGLAGREDQRVGRLSAGEVQRVAVARALAAGRGLLLVDEPTSRLDERSAAALAGLLAELAHGHGVTVVCATHDPVVAAAADATLSLDPSGQPA